MNNIHHNKSKQTVLFLCTGNSCRSQIAEAIVNHDLGDTWLAISAGTKPTGYVHPLAVKVLDEIRITHQGFSKNASKYMEMDINLVVTVCDSAAENCPVWLDENSQEHLAFEDPAAFGGDEQAKLEKFRQVRDEIAEKIPGILTRYE